MEKSRIHNKWPVAKEGFPFILVGICLTALLACLGLVTLTVLAGILCAFVIFFFRDPDRRIPHEEKAVLTPADGTILDVQHLQEGNNPLGEAARKISIFMSVFNVHVNRIPVEGTIEGILYKPGKYFAAQLDKASEENERNTIILKTGDSNRIVVIQIAGLIARRIACWIKEDEHVDAGQRFGLIRFGSRLEVYVPADSRIEVEPRQKVKAGETVIGYLP